MATTIAAAAQIPTTHKARRRAGLPSIMMADAQSFGQQRMGVKGQVFEMIRVYTGRKFITQRIDCLDQKHQPNAWLAVATKRIVVLFFEGLLVACENTQTPNLAEHFFSHLAAQCLKTTTNKILWGMCHLAVGKKPKIA
jgi:hypothetical protein